MRDFPKIRHILSYTRRAVDDYNMISDGDRIAVGLSGGKDSATLLAALASLRRFYPNRFELYGVTISMGFPDVDYKPLEDFCESLEVPFTLKETQLAHVIFDVRKENNPCSLCAKMRRGILHDAAKELGCNKVALGHHFDDTVNTFMLNLFHEGRIGAFLPVTYMSRKDITVIRPLIYVPEKEIRYFTSKNDVPVIKNPCPADGETERESVKQLLRELEKEHKGLKHRIFGALEKSGAFVQTEPYDN